MTRTGSIVLALVLGASSMSVAEIKAVGGGTCPFNVNGTLGPGDLTESPRLFRADPPSDCAAPQPCDGPSGTGPYFYDQYTFVNGGATNCVTVSITSNCAAPGTFSIHTSAYLNAFTPGSATICTDFLGDIGNSPADGDPPKSYSFDVPPGQTFVVVVNHITVGGTCPAPGYDLTVTGCEVPVTLQDFTIQ
jgi:hypothetical protein